MGKRELVALLILSSWCLVIGVWLFLAVPWVCLQFVIAVFPDHSHLLFYLWASAREYLSSGVCKQHRRRPDSASAQSDHRLCYSLFEKYHMQTSYW